METLKARHRLIALFALCSVFSTADVWGKFAPELGRETFQTGHFRVHYPPHYRAFAETLGDRLEDAYAFLSVELGWTPSDKIEVVVRGDTDVANGSAEVFPYNRLVLNAVPPEAWGFFSESDDWIRTLAIHELTHVIANDQTFGFFNFLRFLLGSAAKMNPYQPSWLVEGLAVYEETLHTSRGRGRSVWNDMVLRTSVENALLNALPARGADLRITLDRLNDGVAPWPEGHIPYIFGYVLTQAFADRMGLAAPARVSAENAQIFPFQAERVARATLGVDFSTFWNETVDRLKRAYSTDLERIRREPLTPFRRLTSYGRNTRGWVPGSDGQFYGIRDSEREGTGLSVLEGGRLQNLTDWKWGGGTRVRITADGRQLLYSRLAPFLEHSLFSDIYIYDLQTREEIRLTEGARASDPEISADFEWDSEARKIRRGRIYYLKNLSGGDQAIVARSAGFPDQEISLYAGENFARLGAPSAGRGPSVEWLVFAEKGLNLGEVLRGVRLGADLLALETRAFTPTDDPRSIAATPEWSDDGELLFSSGSGGTYNLFRLSPDKIANRTPLIERVTGLTTGAIQAVRRSVDGKLFAMVYGPGGWDLAEISAGRYPSAGPGLSSLREKILGTAEARVNPPTDVPVTAKTSGAYSVLPALWPKYWAPDIRKVTDGWTLGAQTANYDPWENHRYHLFGGADTRASFPIWNLNYQFDGFYPTLELSVRRENRYFATFRESNQIDTDEARVYMPAGGESYILLGFTASTSRLFAEKESTGGFQIGWQFDRMRTYSDSIDALGERGVRGRFELTGRFVGTERFSSFESRIETRVPSPFSRHFFRLGLNYGSANNDRLSAHYYLGGGEETITRDADFLLRGYPQGTIFGRKILTSNAEYIFPVADLFRGWGVFPVFFERTRMKVFFDAGSAEFTGNDARAFGRWPNAVGAHLLNDFKILYRVPVTFGVGFDYGLARELGGESRLVVGLFSNLP